MMYIVLITTLEVLFKDDFCNLAFVSKNEMIAMIMQHQFADIHNSPLCVCF